MLASFTSYKKPLTQDDEKQEFDELYQLLQKMVKPSTAITPTIPPTEVKNETIEPSIIKEDIVLEKEITTSPDVFEIYKYIRPRGRPKGSKTKAEKKKTGKRKQEKKKHDEEVEVEKENHSNESDEQIEHIPHSSGITCKCCLESFQKNTDYLVHLNTSDICMNVLIQPLYCQPRHELIKPLHLIMDEWLSSALTDGNDHLTCRHCHTSFKTIGNINKHLYTSIPCNRMAYIEFKKIVSDY